MNEDKTVLKIGLAFLVVLAVLGALWRVLAYQQNTQTSVHKAAASVKYAQQKNAEEYPQTLSDIKEQEFKKQ